MRSLWLFLALVLAPNFAHAEPISVGSTLAAFLSTSLITAGSTTLLSVGQALLFVATTALSYGLSALLAPSRSRGQLTSTERTATVSTPVRPLFFGLGELRSGPQRVFSQVTSNGKLWMVLVFDCDETEEITQVFVNNEPVAIDASGNVTAPSKWAGSLKIVEKMGAPDQASLSELQAAFPNIWTADHRLRGLTYLAVEQSPVALAAVNETWPRGPTGEEFTALRKSARMYDPRDASTAYSDNAVLAILHVMTHEYGGQMILGDFELESWKAAASVADASETGPDGSVQKTYRVSGVWEAPTDDGAYAQTLNLLLNNCNARLYEDDENGGKIGIVLDKPGTNADAPFTADDVLSAQLGPSQRLINKRDAVNATFPNENLGYSDDTCPHYPASVTAPQAIENVSLPYCPGRTQAYRLAKFAYQEQSGDAGEFTFGPIGLVLRESECISFSMSEIPAGDWMVSEYKMGATQQLSFSATAIALPSDYGQFDAQTELTEEEFPAAISADGTEIAAPVVCAGSTDAAGTVRVLWELPVEAGLQVEIDWGDADSGVFSARVSVFDPSTQNTTLDASSASGLIDVRVRYRQLSGGATAWTTIEDVDPQALIPAPAAPTVGVASSQDIEGGSAMGTENVTITPTDGDCIFRVYLRVENNVTPATTLITQEVATDGEYPLVLSTGNVASVAADDIVYVSVTVENVSGQTATTTEAITITDSGGGS